MPGWVTGGTVRCHPPTGVDAGHKVGTASLAFPLPLPSWAMNSGMCTVPHLAHAVGVEQVPRDVQRQAEGRQPVEAVRHELRRRLPGVEVGLDADAVDGHLRHGPQGRVGMLLLRTEKGASLVPQATVNGVHVVHTL